MPVEYVVRAGDCLSSIAYQHGFHWKAVWNHSLNAGLRRLRKNPNVLLAGDVVHIPDKAQRWEDRETEKRHRFRLAGVPAKLRVRLVDHQQRPRANLAYTLAIERELFSGVTDSNGLIDRTIPPDAKTGILRFQADGVPQEYELRLGYLDPEDEQSGARQRFTNLGCGFATESSPETQRHLVRIFQRSAGLEETGEIDEATRQKLKDRHGA
jgi:hypothetical protein